MTTDVQEFDLTPDLLKSDYFRITRTGLQVDGEPTCAHWAAFGAALARAEGAVHWWIGDWLNYGEQKYGEKYAQALDGTGFAYQTLRADAYVASRIELLRRRNNLSWSHHREVAALEPAEQDAMLDLAEKEGLTREGMRAAKRKTLATDDAFELVTEARNLMAEACELQRKELDSPDVTIADCREQMRIADEAMLHARSYALDAERGLGQALLDAKTAVTGTEPEPHITIDPEFSTMLPPLSPDELALLEQSIKAEGCRNALVTWNGILLDGHARKAICERHGIAFKTRAITLPDRETAKDWIIRNQMGRCNLTRAQWEYYLGKLYNSQKQAHVTLECGAESES